MDPNTTEKSSTSNSRHYLVRGVIEVVVGALVTWLSIVWLDSLGWGALAFIFVLILGPIAIGLGVLDIIIGLLRKQPRWGILLGLRILIIILSASWLFIGSKP